MKEELLSAIEKYRNTLTLELDKLFWKHFKRIVKNDAYINKFIDIVNVCINISHQPLHFRVSTTIIIPKPNKKFYNSPKVFWPIILPNTISKLLEKVISERLQFTSISNNFIHSYQLGGLKQQSTIDTDVVLTYFIYTEWVKNLTTSILDFDIAQFLPLLNHQLLLLILNKASFNPKVLSFQNYSVDKKTKYFWNSFSSPFFNVDVGVG